MRKIIKRNAEYFLIRLLMILAWVMPRDLGMRIFSEFGKLASYMFHEEVEKAQENLAIAFPRSPFLVRQSMTKAMFKMLGRNSYEFASLGKLSKKRILDLVERVDGMELFEKAYAEGRGLISITGHIGCWELLAAYMSSRGYPVTAMAKRVWIGKLDRKLIKIRQSYGVNTVDRDGSPRLFLDVLRRKEILGVLMDQDARVPGIQVPFFSKPARTPSGIAKLAGITGAIIVPMAIYLLRNMKHEIRILDPIDPWTVKGTKKERIEILTAKCSNAIETLVRIDPKQWIWFHDRWPTRDGAEPGYAAAN
jgi:KDO2-lipid IV(A) lauroyltransferase